MLLRRAQRRLPAAEKARLILEMHVCFGGIAPIERLGTRVDLGCFASSVVADLDISSNRIEVVRGPADIRKSRIVVGYPDAILIPIGGIEIMINSLRHIPGIRM